MKKSLIKENCGAYALITGAAGGIGQGVAELLHQQNYTLILVDINSDILDQMKHQYPGAMTRSVDLSDPSDTETLCQEIESLDGDLAYAFVNAGIVTPGCVIDTDRAALVRDVGINLRSAMCVNHACASIMERQGFGHIINTVSMAAVVSLKGAAAYSASKFGLRGFLIALKSELRAQRVHVSMLLPSAIDTAMLQFEAKHGGSALNFISTPLSVNDVVLAFKKAQQHKKLEYYVPYSDSLLGRLVCVFPQMIDYLYPALEKLGERGRRRFIQSKGI